MHEARLNLADSAGRPSPVELLALAKDLGAFLAGSEEVFLDAGRRIAGLEKRARDLVERARTAGAFRTTGDAEHPGVVLGRELSRMGGHLRTSRAGVAEGKSRLANLLERIEHMLHSQSHFDTIPPTLRVLGLNIRIENARSGTQYAGMETVAAEVRRLGDVVEPLFRGVFQRAASLLATVKAALDSAEVFLHGQDTESTGMLQPTQSALESLQAMARAGAEIGDHAVTASQTLTHDLGALLVALQGHDATRQAIEHVIAELQDLGAGTASSDDDVRVWHARVAQASRVMSAQVRGARERFAGSLDTLLGSLRAISGTGANLWRETERFVASGSGAAAAEAVRRGVEQATLCLLSHVKQEAATGECMGRVVGTVGEMGRSVSDIVGIGTAVKIIALNALVETERAGQGGRVLAVLAQGIGALASEVVQRTGEVSRSLEEISALAASLGAAGAGGDVAEGETIAGELKRLVLRLSEIQRGLEAAVAGMHDGSRALGEEVEALVGRVTKARATAEELAEVEAVLTQLGAAGVPGEGVEEAELGTDRAGGFSRYTMESERAIHDRVVRGVRHRGPAGPAPEAPGGEEGLGANVELF